MNIDYLNPPLEELLLPEETKETLGYEICELRKASNKPIYHLCLMCRKEKKKTVFVKFLQGKGLTCCNKCNQELRRAKSKARHGVDHPFQKQEVKDKIKKSMVERHGVEVPLKSKTIMAKTKQTIRRRYGVDNISQAEFVKQRVRETNIKNFGATSPLKSEDVKTRWRKTNKKKYGVEHPMQSRRVKKKQRDTCLDRYGVDNPLKHPEVRAKIVKTNMERYGVSTALVLEENRAKLLKNIEDKGLEKSFWLEQDFDGCRVDPDQDLPDKWSSGSRKKIKIICSCGKTWEPTFYDFTSGKARTCGHDSGTSRGEQEVYTFIKEDLGVECENRKKIGGFEFDIYVPEKRVCIEYNGLVWHSEKFAKDKHRDYKKSLYCRENGYYYIGIYEDEWKSNRDRIENFLKRVLLNEDGIKIRPKDLRIIYTQKNNFVVRSFLERHHYLGGTTSLKHIWCCYYEEKLIAVFGIGNPVRNNIVEDYELKRVCLHPDYRCYGLWSYLLKRFVVPRLKEGVITSFSDNRRDTGKLYEKLGFELIHRTKPDYWWCDRLVRYHKSGMRKTEEEKKTGLTEVQLREAQGFFRIWDCGKTKWNYEIQW